MSRRNWGVWQARSLLAKTLVLRLFSPRIATYTQNKPQSSIATLRFTVHTWAIAIHTAIATKAQAQSNHAMQHLALVAAATHVHQTTTH